MLPPIDRLQEAKKRAVAIGIFRHRGENTLPHVEVVQIVFTRRRGHAAEAARYAALNVECRDSLTEVRVIHPQLVNELRALTDLTCRGCINVMYALRSRRQSPLGNGLRASRCQIAPLQCLACRDVPGGVHPDDGVGVARA